MLGVRATLTAAAALLRLLGLTADLYSTVGGAWLRPTDLPTVDIPAIATAEAGAALMIIALALQGRAGAGARLYACMKELQPDAFWGSLEAVRLLLIIFLFGMQDLH